MKLKLDVVRDVLLFLEEKLVTKQDSNGRITKNSLMMKEIAKDDLLCQKYFYDDIIYTIIKLCEAEYLDYTKRNSGGDWSWIKICDITFKGHDFLNSIRDKTVFSKVKDVLNEFESMPINAIQYVANQTILSIIKNKLSL